jgi:NAD(P)-dependent dehydrogenase (short-subunit alcohol dehydrogenase family)
VVGALTGRVAIVTGAGRGLGRAHALLLAAEGAAVVVNDLGGGVDGRGADGGVAAGVVAEIEAAGGRAVANGDDVCTMAGAESLVATALDAFGEVHVLVNNAGILRDRMFVNMTHDEWTQCLRGHLDAVFCPTRVAAAHWRDLAKVGTPAAASVVNTTSTSGLIGQVGQSNYGAAKSGIAGLTVILADELARYGVRVNAIAPGARTRMTAELPGAGDLVRAPEDPAQFDAWDPANVSPVVAWLAQASCPVSGKVFHVQGGAVRLFRPWSYGPSLEQDDRWTVAQLDAAMPALLGEPARGA